MIRLALIVALVVLSGCSPASPGRDRDAKALACGVLAVMPAGVAPSPSPRPSPTPTKCENCNGTGRVGDGRVFVPCPVCGGDGVR